MVLITDGNDDADIETLVNALAARGIKHTFTIGVGDEKVTDNLTALAYPTSSNYYNLAAYSDVQTALDTILTKMYDYTDNLFYLDYTSPARAGAAHTLKVTVTGNTNTGASAEISDTFDATGFTSIPPFIP